MLAPHIAIVSAFRNSAGRLGEYFARVRALVDTSPTIHWHVVSVEGDSTDDTVAQLHNELVPLAIDYPGRVRGVLTRHHHGGPVYGSTEQPERLRALSGVFNAALAAIPADCTHAVWVESDLLWDSQTILSLVWHLHTASVDVVAPLTFAGDVHYDLLALRGLDGRRFGPFAPYHPDCVNASGLVEVSSVGSCFAFRGNVAQQCRVRNDYAVMGWCEDVRTHGFRVWLDPTLRVDHPC